MMVMKGIKKEEKEDYGVLKESDNGGEDNDEGGGEVDVERERCVLMVMRGVKQRREFGEGGDVDDEAESENESVV